MAAACRALDFPVVSGNVSLYNETDGNAILPTPNVGGLGVIERLDAITGIAWLEADLTLILLGECLGWLGASLYWSQLVHRDDGAPPPVDLSAERRTGEFLREVIASGRVRACHDLADGGLAVAAAEMCLASRMGAVLDLADGAASSCGWWFGEDQGRYLLAARRDDAAAILAEAAAVGVIARAVGRTGGDALILGAETPISVERLRATHEGWLPAYMAADAGT
jgi:phosphoribosylformylglycinamidine synthase subunit PurL